MKYRMLRKGEKLRKGDECKSILRTGSWVETQLAGQKVEATSVGHYRRPIPEAKMVKPVDWRKVAQRAASLANMAESYLKNGGAGSKSAARACILDIEIKYTDAVKREKRSRK